MANNIYFKKDRIFLTLGQLPIDNTKLLMYDDFRLENDTAFSQTQSLRTESREFLFAIQDSDAIPSTIQFNFFGR